jgi:branched-chain amino acid transport system ATP-binding protein
MLSIRGLSAGYGPLEVIRAVDLDVNKGECLVLIGWSGAGKTTLLKTIAGLIRPTRGEIYYEGRSILNASPRDRVLAGIALVPEGRRLFTGMTVHENLLVGAHTIRDRKAVTEGLARVHELFPILEERNRQVVGTLSGGEQQMCAIGRALMSLPKLMLIDELSLGLAPLVVDRLVGVLADVRRSGMTLILVEQDAALALSMADRGSVLRQGGIFKSGTAAALTNDAYFRNEYLGGQ